MNSKVSAGYLGGGVSKILVSRARNKMTYSFISFLHRQLSSG